jgi:membrane associated rhomboid family serine protease
MSTIANLLFFVVLYAAFMVGTRANARRDGRVAPMLQPLPLLTLGVLLLTGLCAVAQFLHPDLLQRFERNRALLQAGQWWRIVTPLLFQDGGVVGTCFNLVSLALVGIVAERLLGRWRWAVLYLGTGLASEVVAYTLLQHQGSAGNSVANAGLAAGILVTVVRGGERPLVAGSLGGIAAGLILVLIGDLHGAAVLIGCLVAGILSLPLWGEAQNPPRRV